MILKKIIRSFVFCLSGCVLMTNCNIGSKAEFDVMEAINNSSSQYLSLKENLLENPYSQNHFPKTYNLQADTLVTSGSEWWCSGFYPGTLFYLYEETGNKELYEEGLHMLKLLEPEQFNTTTHDLGFMMFCSYGNADRITPQPEYRNILLNSACSLASRFNPVVGCICSHDRKPEEFIVIIDNIMNLELLFWATHATGDSTYYNIVVTHAETTLKNHFRQDNSFYHALDYDQQTGEIRRYIGGQGVGENSAWARGQAWGLYGFTMMYRFTHDSKYLDKAIAIEHFLFNHPNMPSDLIPYWDFDAPDIPDALRDASAATINCAALLELSQYVSPELSNDYFQKAEKILTVLSSDEYLAKKGTNGGFILKHSVGNMPAGTEVDVPLSYADYYYIESLKRYKQIKQK